MTAEVEWCDARDGRDVVLWCLDDALRNMGAWRRVVIGQCPVANEKMNGMGWVVTCWSMRETHFGRSVAREIVEQRDPSLQGEISHRKAASGKPLRTHWC